MDLYTLQFMEITEGYRYKKEVYCNLLDLMLFWCFKLLSEMELPPYSFGVLN